MEGRSDTDAPSRGHSPGDGFCSAHPSVDRAGGRDTDTSASRAAAVEIDDADVALAAVSGERVRPRGAGPFPPPPPPPPQAPPPPGRLHRWLVRAVAAMVAA